MQSTCSSSPLWLFFLPCIVDSFFWLEWMDIHNFLMFSVQIHILAIQTARRGWHDASWIWEDRPLHFRDEVICKKQQVDANHVHILPMRPQRRSWVCRHTRSDIQHEFSGLRFQQQLLSEYRRDLKSLRVSKRQSIEEKAFLREAWVIFAIQADSMYSTELCVSVAMEFRGCCCWYHA